MEESLKEIIENPILLLQTMAVFIPFLILSFWGLSLCFRKIANEDEFIVPRWGWLEACLSIGFFFTVVILMQIVLLQFIPREELQVKIVPIMLMTVVAQFMTCFFLVVLAKKNLKSSWTELGLSRKNISLKKILWATGSYVSFLPLYYFVVVLCYIGFLYMGWEPEQQEIVKFISETKGISLVIVIICASVFVPICEEFFFRVFLYSWFRSFSGVIGGALLSSAFFGLVHYNLLGFFPIMSLGVLFALLYEKTQTIWVPAFIHGLHNGLTISLLLATVK